MQAAREIRERNRLIQIVFLTSSPIRSWELSVRAYYYIQSCLWGEALPTGQAADDSKAEMPAHQNAVQHIQHPYGKIEYIEVSSKKLYFNLTDAARGSDGRLADLEQACWKDRFFKDIAPISLICSGYRSCAGELVTMSGRRVPVIRTVYLQQGQPIHNFCSQRRRFGTWQNRGTVW
jgi:hypothetical protein